MNHYLIPAFVKKLKMKTFKDLKFESFDDEYRVGIHTRIHFENGFGASVVRHNSFYGNKDGLYEIAVLFDNEIHYDNPVAKGDVIGYLTEEQVTEVLIEIQKL